MICWCGVVCRVPFLVVWGGGSLLAPGRSHCRPHRPLQVRTPAFKSPYMNYITSLHTVLRFAACLTPAAHVQPILQKMY